MNEFGKAIGPGNKLMERLKDRTANCYKIKTLFGSRMLKTSGYKEYSSVELKKQLCASLPLKADDLMLICGGRELTEDCYVSPAKIVYAVVRSNAASSISFDVKSRDFARTSMYNINFSASARVFYVKRELQKLTKIPTSAMRVILNGRVLRDDSILGDYVITTKGKDGEVLGFTLFVSRKFDTTKESPLVVRLLNGAKFNTSFSIGERLSKLRDLLWHQTRMPKDLAIKFFLLLSDQRNIEVDETKSLIDYHIDGGKRVEIACLPANVPVSVAPAILAGHPISDPILNHLQVTPVEVVLIGDKIVQISSSSVQVPQSPIQQTEKENARKEKMKEKYSGVDSKKQKNDLSFGGFKKGFFGNKNMNTKPK